MNRVGRTPYFCSHYCSVIMNEKVNSSQAGLGNMQFDDFEIENKDMALAQIG